MISDPDEQLKLVKNKDTQWYFTYNDNDVSKFYKNWRVRFTGAREHEYFIILKLHSSVHEQLIHRYPHYIKIFQDNLVIYRILKKKPEAIDDLIFPCFHLQRFAFKHADHDLKMKMINRSIMINDNFITDYIRSQKFEDEYGYPLLGKELGIFDE